MQLAQTIDIQFQEDVVFTVGPYDMQLAQTIDIQSQDDFISTSVGHESRKRKVPSGVNEHPNVKMLGDVQQPKKIRSKTPVAVDRRRKHHTVLFVKNLEGMTALVLDLAPCY